MWTQLKKMARNEEKKPWHLSQEEFSKVDKDKMFDAYLAKAQREAPEKAMVRIRRTYGGGVLNPVVENVGDLTHRMSEIVTSQSSGYQYVREKVEKVLWTLESPYGFEKGMYENIKSNAEYHKQDPKNVERQVVEQLKTYADEHRKLPVFNKAQKMARDAAIAVGEMRWNDVIGYLKDLKKHLDQGVEHWTTFAREIDRNIMLQDARSKGKTI